MHHFNKLEGTWKPICNVKPPTVLSDTATEIVPVTVVNDDAFNPTKLCKDARYCTGQGGLLAFMEAPSASCSTQVKTPTEIQTALLSGGAIAGIVLGIVCGTCLICLLVWLCLKRE
jgi:hypothetical protein